MNDAQRQAIARDKQRLLKEIWAANNSCLLRLDSRCPILIKSGGLKAIQKYLSLFEPFTSREVYREESVREQLSRRLVMYNQELYGCILADAYDHNLKEGEQPILYFAGTYINKDSLVDPLLRTKAIQDSSHYLNYLNVPLE